MREVWPPFQMWSGARAVAVAFDVCPADGVGVVVLDDVFVVVRVLLGESNVVGFGKVAYVAQSLLVCLDSRDSLSSLLSLSHDLGA